MDKIIVGMASGLGAIAVVLILMVAQVGVEHTGNPYVPEDNNSDGSNNTSIIISKGIDDIDSGVTFDPPFARTIMGINNTITWVNHNDTSVTLQSPYDGYLFKNITIAPGESFSFTFNRTGTYPTYEINAGKDGIILVSTEEIEYSRLVVSAPSILQDDSKDLEMLATTVIQAAQKDDDISSIRLNNTRLVAYTTDKGGDVIVPRDLCISCTERFYQPIFYRSPLGNPIIYPSEGNMERMKNFTNAVMQEIGYTMDGTEWIDAVNYGDRADITISQKVTGGWILPIPNARFGFMTDWTWIELGRWYDSESLSNFEFGLGSQAAEEIAVNFMNNEVSTNVELEKYRYELSRTGEARITIIDDKVMYVVPTGYSTTNKIYYDDIGHCGEPASGSFDVLVDAATGTPFNWQYSSCA